MSFILTAVIVLGAIALIAAVILYVCSKKFAVKEDPRIAQVSALLPGANCGGCGFPGCSGMADALVKGADAGSLEGLMCPVGGADVMGQVADLLGMAIANTDPMVAVVRCWVWPLQTPTRWWPLCVVMEPASCVRVWPSIMDCAPVRR